MMRLHDAHCHLDFMANGEEVAREAAGAGAVLFANTVTPRGFVTARARFDELPNVRLGLGLHPWWVRADGGLGLEATGPAPEPSAAGSVSEGSTARELLELLGATRFVGEIGLDFGRRHAATRDAQTAAFSQVARACGEAGGKVLSLHSVGAAREVLDALAAGGALESCTCIFHWYSGPSDQLKRAIDAGCYFSVNGRMLATRRGPEYVKAIPAARLLLETDAPPGENAPCSWAAMRDELSEIASAIRAIKGPDSLNTIASTAWRLMG